MEVHYGTDRLPAFRNAVITIGSFDGVHCGHQKLLAEIRDIARQIDGESVVITFDPHPRQVLRSDQPLPGLLNTTAEKIALLARFGIQHVVIVPFTRDFARQRPEDYIKDFLCQLFHPRIIVIGYDHRFGTDRKGNIQYLKQFEAAKGFSVHEIAKETVEMMEVSSTRIRQALHQGDISTANKLLGYPYMISGKVVRGDGIGKQLGFPTANLQLQQSDKLIPGPGIYACEVTMGEEVRKAMLYIGHRPTVDQLLRLVIEVHILDYDGQLYDRELSVVLLQFIRGDQSFPSFETLKQQIVSDEVTVRQYFKTASLAQHRYRNSEL